MKPLTLIIFFLLLVFYSVTLAATPAPLYTIFTASPRGTYYQIGQDLQRACPNLNIQVVVTNGSLDNINQLIQKPALKVGNRFALVQNDAMVSIFGTEPRVRGLIKPVLEMYDEDITILVSTDSHINTLEDLKGKRVAVGVVGSGTWFSSSAIRSQLNLSWIPVEQSPEESILQVITGELDALVMVGGNPLPLYSELGKAMKSRVKLLSLRDLNPSALYKRSTLPKNVYLWQDAPVELRATRSMLMAAADVSQQEIDTLLSCMSDAKNELRRWGHSKWNSVRFPTSKNSRK